MTMPDEEHILAEIKANLAEGDLVKARLVVASLAGQREELQQAVIEELTKADSAIAIPVLGNMLDLRIGDLSVSRLDIAATTALKVLEDWKPFADLSVDAQIHVSTALGDTHDARALRPLRQLLNAAPDSANLRFTVYEALSKIHMRASGYMLAAGLEDRDASVRVAAARAIEKNLDDNLKDGLLNMMRNPAPTPEHIVSAIAQAGAMGTLEAMLSNDTFARLLGIYLEKTPDHDLMEKLSPILNRSERRNLAAMVDTFLAATETLERPLIYAVDDSPMILRMYRAALSAPHCTVKTFENPFEALEWVDKEKPDLLFTDLNMPEIDGIELASTLRSGDHADDFPIVMVTTQSYGDDIERAMHSGVDSFVQKPFKSEDLVDVINELTDYSI